MQIIWICLPEPQTISAGIFFNKNNNWDKFTFETHGSAKIRLLDFKGQQTDSFQLKIFPF